MTLPMNTIQIGPGGPSSKELLIPGQTSRSHVIPLHEKPKYITTHAVRVGGGYELHTVEKPVREDKANIRLLRHLIGLKQQAKRELLGRIDLIIDDNIRLAQANELVGAQSYHSSLLQHQRELAKLQHLQAEKASTEEALQAKREEVTALRQSTSDTVLKLSESLQNVQERLDCEERRVFELRNYDERSRPLLAIKEQQLIDEIDSVTDGNKNAIEEQERLAKARHKRDRQDHDVRVHGILDRSAEKVLGRYSNRFIQELYLNNQMKFEIDYCRAELEILRSEINTVTQKISKVPKKTFHERVVEPESEVNNTFIFNDFPPVEAPPPKVAPSKHNSAKPIPAKIQPAHAHIRAAAKVHVQNEISYEKDPVVYTFNIEKKLHLPI